ncbi:MAG: tryptophan 2,3-dioxygenase family protein [Acidobacteriota bacterium]
MSHTGPILEGQGASDYERYLRVPELLALQKEADQLIHPEERLFQIVHQSAELWLKEVDYEIDRAVAQIVEGHAEPAADLLHRCTLILDLLREQIVILETMAPADYHVIRVSSLGRGSGGESPGFSRLLTAGKRLWPPFEEMLTKRDTTLIAIERDPRGCYELFRLVQALMDYDAAFMKWRYTHLRLAVRIIGARVSSLKGVPVNQLEFGTREPLFPQLWETINELTAEFKPQY